MKLERNYITLLLILAFLNPSFAANWNKIKNIAGCADKNLKLLSLMNLLCNTTQLTSTQSRDACYGCFFRAGNTLNGLQQLSSLNDCARLYIANTSYAVCAANLQASIDGTLKEPLPAEFSTGPCFTGYCEFVRCVRRINTQNLISTCYMESLGTRALTDNLDRIYFYTNVSSCILAKTRCSQYNPISGELQNTFGTPANTAAANVWFSGSLTLKQLTSFNALHITETGDLRIINFPAITTIAAEQFCARRPLLQQTGFGVFVC